MISLRTPLCAVFLALIAVCGRAADQVIADFESETYAPWTTTGTAFGPGPAAGTLPNQMQVDRYQGSRLVNSFYGGDDAVGTLTSPEFEITHPHLNFLIGGGGFAGETCVHLRIDGEVVRTATGPNTTSGGSEALAWTSWDVARWKGQSATLQIIDNRRGSWGHISADQFVLSDAPRQTRRLEHSLRVTGRYLHLPVRTGAPKVWMNLFSGENRVRRFEIELDEEKPDFMAAAELQPWVGESLKLEIEQTDADPDIFDAFVFADHLPASDEIYSEPTRPAFHFTSKIGWLNDPNGLVYDDGTWHLFYQHNPFGWNWGNMHWGHATSTDLIHWTEQGDAIHPWSDAQGAAFSGSGLVDSQNTSGLGDGQGDLLVFPFTDTAIGESLAYSNDDGQTLRIFDGNPVLRHQGRDPKVIWHAPTDRWVMAVYDEAEGKQWIAFYTSSNLQQWTFESRIEGFYECPDLFPLQIDDSGRNSWVLYAADGQYVLGDFDGRHFTPSHEGKYQTWFGDFYAAQTYSDAPQNRRVQIGWGRNVVFPGQRFNQQMVVPVELTLRETDAGVRMFAWPVRELDTVSTVLARVENRPLSSAPLSLAKHAAPLDIALSVELDDQASLQLDVGGALVSVDATAGTLKVAEITAPLEGLRDRTDSPAPLQLRVLVDRGSIEVFVDAGRVAVSKSWQYGREPVSVTASAPRGTAMLLEATIGQVQADRR